VVYRSCSKLYTGALFTSNVLTVHDVAIMRTGTPVMLNHVVSGEVAMTLRSRA